MTSLRTYIAHELTEFVESSRSIWWAFNQFKLSLLLSLLLRGTMKAIPEVGTMSSEFNPVASDPPVQTTIGSIGSQGYPGKEVSAN